MAYMYKAFGFHILSEICLPELIPMEQVHAQPDIHIFIQPETYPHQELGGSMNGLVVSETSISFGIPGTGTFRIQNGRTIEIFPLSGADPSATRLYVLGSCMGAILLQRKVLPLHGSTIAIEGKAYTFVGDSGAGKSTLASSFLHKGYTLLSDDISPVILSSYGTPYVVPAYPQQKLWQDSLIQFGKETSHYEPLIDRETKFAIPVTSAFVRDPMPLAGIYEITKTDKDSIDIYPIPLLERLPLLFHHTYRRFFIPSLRLHKWHFRYITRFAHQIEAFRIGRPVSKFTAHSLAERILQTIEMEVLR